MSKYLGMRITFFDNRIPKLKILLIVAVFQLYACSNDSVQENIEIDIVPAFSYKTGDIIFQHSSSLTNEAIQLATHSNYSHCGVIIVDENSKVFVMHAGHVVKKEPLLSFVNNGESNKFVVKRLSKEIMPEREGEIVNYLMSIENKTYDYAFSWSDDEIYCSELVWKAYKESFDIDLCSLRRLEEFDLSSVLVGKVLSEKYNDNIPYEEKVVSPEDIFVSNLLVQIYPN